MTETSNATARTAIILAAGMGTRMKSSLPKVMHRVAGKPMVDWSIDLALASGCTQIIVVCSPGQAGLQDHVAARLGEGSLAIQHEQLGTGDAVKAARDAIGAGQGTAVVLYGDTPLIQPAAVAALCELVEADTTVGVLGFEANDPGAYGRLIADEDGALARIVEAKDATPEELAVKLCNSGVVAAQISDLFGLLDQTDNNNAKGEYYLTDIVGLANSGGGRCETVICDEADVLGVNSRPQLAEANAAFQTRQRAAFMADGVTLEAPETVFFSHDTMIARDVVIEPHIVFGPGVTVEEGAHIRAFSHLEGAHVASDAVIGPYARLRPGAQIEPGARVGNFVEIKKSRIGAGAKVNHLAYVGDGDVGEDANLGAGTIFCNYDGYDKHVTHVGKGAFVGSNSSLVAPVRIGDGAYIGSGSVITKDVAGDALAVARGKQVERAGWASNFRARKESDDGK